MTTAITIGMIIIYVAIMMGIGVYTARQTRSVSDFVLGSHSVGSWLTAFAYGTSYFSAVVFIGYAGQFGWTYGVSAAWVGVGNALLGSLLAWIVLGRRTRIMTQSLGAKTMPEYFEKRWNSKGLKIAAALIVFVFLIPYTASVYNGLSRLFNMAFQIESEGAYKIIIIVMALLTAIYVILGGYAATAINDFIQGIVMLIGIAAVVICAIQNQGGLTSALAALGEIEVNGKTNTLNSVFGPDPLNLLGVVILTSLGTWGLPQMIHKFYAIKSENDIKKGAVISTVFALIVAGGSTLIAIICGIPAAYALARMKFKGKKIFLGIVIISQMFAPVVLLVGIYKIMSTFGMTDSLVGLVFINAAFNQAFAIWLLRGTFISISPEMEQAATVDGCGKVSALIRILLPVAAPGIVTALIFVFINAWNEYTVALTLISTDVLKPLTGGITIFNGYNMVEWQYLFASSLFATVPVIILFVLIEKHLVGGLTSGGVKG